MVCVSRAVTLVLHLEASCSSKIDCWSAQIEVEHHWARKIYICVSIQSSNLPSEHQQRGPICLIFRGRIKERGRLPSPHSPSIHTNYAIFISYPTSWRLAAKTIGQRGRALNTEWWFLPWEIERECALDVRMRLKSSHPARVKRRGHAHGTWWAGQQ